MYKTTEDGYQNNVTKTQTDAEKETHYMVSYYKKLRGKWIKMKPVNGLQLEH